MSTPRSLIFASLLLLPLAGQVAAEDLRLGLGNIGLRATVAPVAHTPQLQAHATPFTVWLDFHRLAANRWIPGELPDWLAPVEAGAQGRPLTVRMRVALACSPVRTGSPPVSGLRGGSVSMRWR